MAYSPLQTNYYEEVQIAADVPMVEAGHAAWKEDRLEDVLAASDVGSEILDLSGGLSNRQARTLHGALRCAAQLADQSGQQLLVDFLERRYGADTEPGEPYHYVYVREDMPRAVGPGQEEYATEYRLAVLFL